MDLLNCSHAWDHLMLIREIVSRNAAGQHLRKEMFPWPFAILIN